MTNRWERWEFELMRAEDQDGEIEVHTHQVKMLAPVSPDTGRATDNQFRLAVELTTWLKGRRIEDGDTISVRRVEE